VHRKTDALSCAEAAGVTSEPVRARRAVVKEVGVNVDEHPALPLLLLLELGRQSGRDILRIRDGQIQIGFLGLFLFQYSILIVYIVEIIDGGFTR
jgi:hypothetical protein